VLAELAELKISLSSRASLSIAKGKRGILNLSGRCFFPENKQEEGKDGRGRGIKQGENT